MPQHRGKVLDPNGGTAMGQLARRVLLTIAGVVVLGVPLALSTPEAAFAATACTRVGNCR